jgi:hypothetical protein
MHAGAGYSSGAATLIVLALQPNWLWLLNPLGSGSYSASLLKDRKVKMIETIFFTLAYL